MSSKRKSVGSSTNFNFRPQTEARKGETKGTKPLPSPVTIKETLLTMILQLCRKLLFFNTNLRVGIYIAGLFLSFVFDVAPFPRSYFSRSDNVFNQYFVKIGWGWTLVLTVPFVFLTSFTYCCGNRKLILWHLSRLGIATMVWFTFTTMFSLLDGGMGKCSKMKDFYKTRKSCTSNGYSWHTLDISGHTFILIWSTLVIIEESRVINGWESVKDMIRNEVHSRAHNDVDLSSPLKKLTDSEFQIMRSSYRQFTPYVKALFLSMTCLTIIWDVMVVATILYFHIMIEKMIAGLIAVGMWFFTYKYWYIKTKFPPEQPGQGLFKYVRDVSKQREDLTKSKYFISNLHNKKPGQVQSPATNTQGLKGQEKSKDDLNLFESELHRKNDKSKQDDMLQQPSMGTGVTTRSQALKNLRIDGNKTI